MRKCCDFSRLLIKTIIRWAHPGFDYLSPSTIDQFKMDGDHF